MAVLSAPWHWTRCPRPPRTLSGLVLLLGVVFLAAGLAKLPVLGSFTGTVAGILHAGTPAALAAALCVIAVEIACGAALVLRRRVRPASLLLAGQTTAFLWVLYPAASGEAPLVCNCFGVLGIHLSTPAGFAFDLALLDLLLLAAALWPAQRTFPVRRRPVRTASIIALVLALTALEGLLLGSTLAAGAPPPPAPELLPALAYARQASPDQAPRRPGRMMLFLLNFTDFTCPLCFEDFIALADAVHAAGLGSAEGKVLGLMREGGAERLREGGRLHRWAGETGLDFRLMFLPDGVFDAAVAGKSMVAVLDEQDRVLFRAGFPMGAARRHEALALLQNEAQSAH